MEYRRLLFFEKVRKGDEVQSRFGYIGYESWSTDHTYYGKISFFCKGYLTGKRQKFRRPIKKQSIIEKQTMIKNSLKAIQRSWDNIEDCYNPRDHLLQHR